MLQKSTFIVCVVPVHVHTHCVITKKILKRRKLILRQRLRHSISGRLYCINIEWYCRYSVRCTSLVFSISRWPMLLYRRIRSHLPWSCFVSQNPEFRDPRHWYEILKKAVDKRNLQKSFESNNACPKKITMHKFNTRNANYDGWWRSIIG
jgi:hypothetical protein